MSVPRDFSLLLDELREEVAQAGNDQKKIVDSLKVLHSLAGDCVIEAAHLCELKCVTKCVGATGRQIYEVSGPNKGYSTLYKLYPRINYCVCSVFQKKVVTRRQQLTVS
uniref:Uncharacterized protein n=1 Tax=Plectus sambesii TaxID=2011161 RepID=A0A914W0X4_9BILA